MKTPPARSIVTLICGSALAVWLPYNAFGAPFTQGTAFTYQGQLYESGLPANGSNDLRFAIFDNALGGLQISTNLTVEDVIVSGGLFSATLDWGGTPFDGYDRWFEISVRPGNSTGNFTPLSPRQKLAPSPSALFALSAGTAATATNLLGTLGSGQLGGTYGNLLRLTNAGNVFSGSGTGLSSLDASQLASGVVPLGALSNAWKTTGNSGTLPGIHFLGTTDNQPLEIKVNGARVLRLEPQGSTTRSPNVIGGSPANFVATGVYGATIAGGGTSNSLAFEANSVSANFGLIGGGQDNKIQTGAIISTIGGGAQNTITNASLSTIGGGIGNTIQYHAIHSTIGGGSHNIIENLAYGSTIGGGGNNSVSGEHGTVPGGYQNAAGMSSFAVGRQAKATHTGSFVWADFTFADFSTTSTNQFLIRASGGVGIGKNNPATALDVNGTVTATAFNPSSDRDLKENFRPVDAGSVLEKIAALPVSEWNFRSDPAVRHLGPMAQDFHAAFGVGTDERHIATVDADGVALAAIQGLNQKVEGGRRKAETEINALKAENAALKARLEKIEQLLSVKLAGGAK